MKAQYLTLLRMAQCVPKKGESVSVVRAHKEAKEVVRLALTTQLEYTCSIGNTNLYDDVMNHMRNIVLCPSMIEGYCTHLNEILSGG